MRQQIRTIWNRSTWMTPYMVKHNVSNREKRKSTSNSHLSTVAFKFLCKIHNSNMMSYGKHFHCPHWKKKIEIGTTKSNQTRIYISRFLLLTTNITSIWKWQWFTLIMRPYYFRQQKNQKGDSFSQSQVVGIWSCWVE